MTLPSITSSVSASRFESFAAHLAREMDADMVLSAPGYPAQTTSVIGIRPVAELIFTPDTTPDDVKSFCFATPGVTMGFVSYTYGMMLRGIASTKPDDFPLGHLKHYTAIVEHDPATLVATIRADHQWLCDKLATILENSPEEASGQIPHALPSTPPEVSLDQAGYEAGVRETLERILSGYTYQLNLSTRFRWHCPDLDPLALFFSMRRTHPAPFYAWLGSGPHRVLSTSPERFLRVTDGRVLSQPIKGTLRADIFSPELAARLTNSPKEDAELSMIVDLIRNDISANCAYGSVRVDNHKSVFHVDTLLQMYSDVTGDLRSDRDCLDLFFDAFPGGSVTGCPKLSSMRIIEELEPHSRGMYCGSVLIVRDERNMDSSIAIRTAVHDTRDQTLEYCAGSGIVVDSDPASEYQETMDKAEKILRSGEP